MTKIEKILDIDHGRELSQPSASRLRPKIRCRPGISYEAGGRGVFEIYTSVCRSAVWPTYAVLLCVGGIPQSYWAVKKVASNVERRHILLFRVYVYVVTFPSPYVIPFIRQRCSVSVDVRYSVYTSTLFRFCQYTLFRLYVYVVPFLSMYVIPFIRQR